MAGKTKNVIAKRPRKSGTDRRKRVNVHMKRLLALGVPEAQLKHMTVVDIRTMLKAKQAKNQKSIG